MAQDTAIWTELSLNIKFVELMLPVGISFFTFQAIGYIMDVHKHSIEAERNFVDVALFFGFFPQISAGPIGRASSQL